MKSLDKYNVQKISSNEAMEISGGRIPWNPIFLAIYIIDEIWDGATRDCSSSCNHS